MSRPDSPREAANRAWLIAGHLLQDAQDYLEDPGGADRDRALTDLKDAVTAAQRALQNVEHLVGGRYSDPVPQEMLEAAIHAMDVGVLVISRTDASHLEATRWDLHYAIRAAQAGEGPSDPVS